MVIAKICIIILAAILITTLYACGIQHPQSISMTAAPDIEPSRSPDKMLQTLKALISKQLQELNISAPFFTSEEILNIIHQKETTIQQVNKKLDLPSGMIEAIICKEQSMLGLSDQLAGMAVKNFYSKSETSSSTGILNKDDSSTGLGQIFARTAISAEQTINNNTKLDQNSLSDVKDMWYKLQDPDENIYYIGLVLKAKAKEAGINLKKADSGKIEIVFSRYNGSGKNAAIYGAHALEYFNLFKK